MPESENIQCVFEVEIQLEGRKMFLKQETHVMEDTTLLYKSYL